LIKTVNNEMMCDYWLSEMPKLFTHSQHCHCDFAAVLVYTKTAGTVGSCACGGPQTWKVNVRSKHVNSIFGLDLKKNQKFKKSYKEAPNKKSSENKTS